MRKVIFTKVGFENFNCYTSQVEFLFKNNKVCLIVGPNGIGKSSIFKALAFALYGITETGLRGEDVVNNKVGKNCHIYTEFIIDDDTFKVDRFIKHSKEGDTVYLKKNNNLIKKGHREVVPEIERILIPQKLFMNTLFFGQKIKTFFTDLTDSDQKDIFRKVLQLDLYTDYYNYASLSLKNLNEEKEEVKNSLRVKSTVIEEITKSIKREEDNIKEFKKKQEEIISNLQLKIDDLTEQHNILLKESEKYSDDYETELSVEREKFNKLNTELQLLDNNYDFNKREIKNKIEIEKNQLNIKYNDILSKIIKEKNLKTEEVIQKFREEIQIAQENLSQNNNELSKVTWKVKELESKISSTSKDIIDINKSVSKEQATCFACGQKIGIEERKKLETIIESKRKEIEEVGNLKEKCGSLFEKLSTKKNELELKLQNLTKKEKEEKENIISRYVSKENLAKEKVLDYLKKISLKLEELIDIETEKYKSEKYNKSRDLEILENRCNDILKLLKEKRDITSNSKLLESEISQKKNEINIVKERKVEDIYKTNLKNLQKDLLNEKSNFDSLLTRSTEIENEIETYEFWKIGYSMTGIPSMLIDEAIPFMNSQIMTYLDQIGSRYIVSFDTLNETKSGEFRDKIKVNVLDTITKANSRKQLSGGQTRIIDISTILTLRDLQSKIQDMSINIVLLDEIFDSLDEQNISYVSTLLRKISTDLSINIISHTQIDQIDADEIYRLS